MIEQNTAKGLILLLKELRAAGQAAVSPHFSISFCNAMVRIALQTHDMHPAGTLRASHESATRSPIHMHRDKTSVVFFSRWWQCRHSSVTSQGFNMRMMWLDWPKLSTSSFPWHVGPARATAMNLWILICVMLVVPLLSTVLHLLWSLLAGFSRQGLRSPRHTGWMRPHPRMRASRPRAG